MAKRKNSGWLVGLVLGAGFFLLGRSAFAKGRMTRMQLSKNFNLDEFLRSSTYPDLKFYKPDAGEIENVKRLVTLVLQPMRDQFGEVVITSGARPQNVNINGKSLDQALRDKGYDPSDTSDHHDMSAADFKLKDSAKLSQAFDYLKTLVSVRQVIMYYNADGSPNHIHVAVAGPSKPRFTGDKFAFVEHATGTALA